MNKELKTKYIAEGYLLGRTSARPICKAIQSTMLELKDSKYGERFKLMKQGLDVGLKERELLLRQYQLMKSKKTKNLNRGR